MDQASSPYQAVLRHVGERSESANLDCRVGVCARSHHQKRLNLDVSLDTLLQVFSVTLLEKIPLNKALFDTEHILDDDMMSNQLNLFDI